MNGCKCPSEYLEWLKIMKDLRTVGPYQPITFSDKITKKSINEMGGWLNLCHLSYEQLEKQSIIFFSLYNYYRDNM